MKLKTFCLALAMLPGDVHAANPSFASFNTNQFNTTAFQVSVRDGVSNAAPVQRVVTTIQGEALLGFKLGDQIARLPQPLSFILSQDIRFERVPETNSVTPTNAASAPVRGARGRPKP